MSCWVFGFSRLMMGMDSGLINSFVFRYGLLSGVYVYESGNFFKDWKFRKCLDERWVGWELKVFESLDGIVWVFW